MSTEDSIELEALFDSVAAECSAAPAMQAAPAAPEPGANSQQVFEHIGHAARKLHDALKGLGLEEVLSKATNTFPDARERLDYVATLTEKAAMRVLTAIETAQPAVNALGDGAVALDGRWQQMLAGQISQAEFKPLVLETHQYLKTTADAAEGVSGQLNEIMMAQDFQDLTGQVIKRLSTMVQDLEGTLVNLLVAAAPPERLDALDAALLNGPVINAEGRSDVVTSQEQVDDLLASLGF